MEEQDMVHQRELQQKEEYFSGELKRHEQELPEVADRMREPTWELSKTVAQAVWAAEGQSGGESQRRRSTRIKRKHEDQRGRHMKSESEQCGNGKSGYSAIIIILFSHLNAYWSNKCEIFFCVFCASVVKNQFTITGSMKHESFKIKFDNITMILNSLRIKSWSDLQPRIDVISRSLRQNGWMNNQTVDCKENADLHLYCNNQMPFWSQ